MIQRRTGARVQSKRVVRAAAGTILVVVSTIALGVLPQAVAIAGASGILPPSNPSQNVPSQVVPACTGVDDNSAGCIDSVLHNINYARSLEGLGPLVLPADYASQTVSMQQLIIADEERGDRGLSQYSGLDANLNTAAQTGANTNSDPALPNGYKGPGGSNFALDYTPLGADFAWMYDDGYGGTNLLCASSTSTDCWGHRDNVLGAWGPVAGETALMGVGETASGQYAQIFAYQNNPSDTLVDPLTPSSLPTPSSAATPDVVQVLPASSSSTSAGTPVTIEGNYFGATPTVDFGGVAASNVHLNWDGELTADAPADPAGTAAATVTVTVTTTGGTSSSTGVAQVNEFTYAPSGAPRISAISPSSGSELACGRITITGTNFNDGATPIVDFGTVASIGSFSDTSNSITTTIPQSLSAGPVNVTVTTPAGTTPVSGADSYTYTSSGSTDGPCITSNPGATFAAGSANSTLIIARGTPAVTSISDTAFSGCTPSALPSDIALVYGSGAVATLEGTPSTSDNSSYTICLDASNGSTAGTQSFTLTVTGTTPPAPPPPPPPPPPVASHGYWLVGSDGGIFSFGSAQFHGSMGGVVLQRPVVGIVPTPDRGGYWLDASDGGVFAFGDTQYYGSMPGLGFNPAGSGKPHSLNAPIVGMVPSHDDRGYFMVASDGGVFAFGDATFAGSCPGIGGCNGAAVAVVPDATGGGYWVVTNSGAVYAFGDAVNHGQPGTQGSAVTSAVATPDGGGYWILDAGGQVFPFGDAANLGGPPGGSAGGLDPAASIFSTSDGGGYWVVTAGGTVYNFGDAPSHGDMSGTHLNGPIIAASGS